MRRLALVGLTLALSACSPEVDPVPPVANVIPDGFPLSVGMASEAYDDVSISAQSVGMRALDFCGRKPLRGLTPADRLAAEASGNEYAHTRDLMLFTDTGSPRSVLEDIRAAASACPAEHTGRGSRLLTEVTDSSFGSDAATLVHTYEQGGAVGTGAEIIEVVLVGRALLVTSTYAEWDPATNLDEGIAEEAERLEDTVAAMSMFRNVPESSNVTPS